MWPYARRNSNGHTLALLELLGSLDLLLTCDFATDGSLSGGANPTLWRQPIGWSIVSGVDPDFRGCRSRAP